MVKVKKEMVKVNFYFTIVDLLKQGKTAAYVANILGVKKQNLTYYIATLKREGVLKNIGKGVWEVNEANFIAFKGKVKVSSLGTTKVANLHALNINIPILSGEIDFKSIGGYEHSLNNWNVQYKRIPGLSITLRNNNNRTLSVFLWGREIPNYQAIPNICHSVVHQVTSLMKEKGVNLDYFGWRVSTLHIAMRNEDIDKVLNKGMSIEIALGREAEKITERDLPREAKAWIDTSPFNGVETDDIGYYRNYVLMPENIAALTRSFKALSEELIPTINNLNENIKSHVEAVQGINQGIKRLNKILNQRRLYEFI